MEVKPGYKQTEVGVIPEDWEVNGLCHFWNVRDCKHVTAQFIANGYPVASIKEVQSRFVDLTDAKQTTHEFYKLLIEGGRKPLVGDLILSRNATVGEVAQVAKWHPPFAMGQDVCLLRKKSVEFSTNYLQEVFRSPIIEDQLSDLMVGSTFKRANVQQIKNFIVPMPSSAEQKAIAEALSDADALIESLEQLITKKRHLKQGAMQWLLSPPETTPVDKGKLKMDNEKNSPFSTIHSPLNKRLPGFSGEWERKPLKKVIQIPVTDGPHLTPKFLNDGVPFLSVNNLANNRIDLSSLRYISKEDHAEFSRKCKPQKGDVLLGKAASVGRVAIIDIDMEFNIWSPIALIRVNNANIPRFVYYVFQTAMVIRQIELLTNSSSQGNIGMGDIERLMFLLPEKKEQQAIADILSDMDAEIAALETKLSKSRQLKQGMMQELLTGKTRLVDSGKLIVENDEKS